MPLGPLPDSAPIITSPPPPPPPYRDVVMTWPTPIIQADLPTSVKDLIIPCHIRFRCPSAGDQGVDTGGRAVLCQEALGQWDAAGAPEGPAPRCRAGAGGAAGGCRWLRPPTLCRSRGGLTGCTVVPTGRGAASPDGLASRAFRWHQAAGCSQAVASSLGR